MEGNSPGTRAQRICVLAFAALVAAACLAASGSAAGGGQTLPLIQGGSYPSGRQLVVQPGVATTGAGYQRVTITLTSSPAGAVSGKTRLTLSGRMSGRAAARAAAQKSPRRAARAELRAATSMERRRNAAMRSAARAAIPNTKQAERIGRVIVALGGRIEQGPPIPGAITALLPKRAMLTLSKSRGVAAIAAAPKTVEMASPVDGSATWRANGLYGQAPNAENPSTNGPDVIVYDEGITTAHVAFNTRLPSDCATCIGSGPSADPAHPQAGAHTRVISPASRMNFSGSDHGNTIAAAIASTNFSGSGDARIGSAYGIDKLYDPTMAKNGSRWLLGMTYQGEAGVSDLPEVMNFSQGVYQDTVGFDPYWIPFDGYVDDYGMSMAVASGNCGVRWGADTGCGIDGPHRVASPANLYNVLSVGAWNAPDFDPATWTVWQHSSVGPTWDGRKKPDLIASPYGTAGGPLAGATNENAPVYNGYGNTGQGTSYAAPMVAAGAALLASVGVYSPVAQRAILINNARPIQNQTYWTPSSGWGALDLDSAFTNRARYASSTVTGSGTNSARFFRETGVTIGDRTTLTWNRRQHMVPPGVAAYYDLTNLDLFQLDPGTLASSATGGSDAADTVDTNQLASGTPDPNAPGKFGPGNNAATDNPMPGSGTDGGDNIEQVRSTASGTQLIKVKALSPVDGRASEPFSLAAANPITALQSPIPVVTITPSAALSKPGDEVTLTVNVTNPSSDLPLTGASVQLDSLPGNVTPVGSTSTSLGTIPVGGSASTAFTVQGTGDGAAEISATASGTTYSESFGGSGTTSLTFDGTPPAVTLTALPAYSTTAAPEATWSAEDSGSGVAAYDVDQQINGGSWMSVIASGSAASLALGAGEGQVAGVRVRARDNAGNLSAWQEASTTIDAIAPTIAIGASSSPARGRINVPVAVSNVGAPIVASTYVFSVSGTGSAQPLAGSATFFNAGVKSLSAQLVVSARDALGRSVSKTQRYTVPPHQTTPTLSINPLRTANRRLRIRGTISRDYNGRLAVAIDRRSRAGTRKVRRSIRPRNGRFLASIRLRPGNYRVRIRALGTADHLAQSRVHHFTVR